MKDAKGLEICSPKVCPVCGDTVSTRPDGSVRYHSRWKYPGVPRLGVMTCEGGRRPTEAM